jgi:hypothetical protein
MDPTLFARSYLTPKSVSRFCSGRKQVNQTNERKGRGFLDVKSTGNMVRRP